MNKLLLIGLLAIGFAVNAQETKPASGGPPPKGSAPAVPDLPRFDLDFKGGLVQEFVDALNKELNGRLNVIIPSEAEATMIPPMKMTSVNVSQVFEALQQASRKFVPVRYGNMVQERVYAFNFTTTSKPVTETSVWAFSVDRPRPEAEEPGYRFYQLGPYLGPNGLKIEDITTAIQTALKMLKQEPGPTLKFHPETKLLIVVGKDSEFRLIDDVLKELPKGASKVVRLSEVLVNGNVNKPGNIPLAKDQKLTIIDAIGRAGGLNPKSPEYGSIKFTRPGENERSLRFDELKKENDPTKIIYLEPGDVIEVK
jgi:hypothetical protein